MKQKKEVRPNGRTQREKFAKFNAMHIVPESQDKYELARAFALVLVIFLGYFIANLVDAGVFF